MKLDLENFLTPKQQRFCYEYLKDLNATRAALAAGYSRSTAMNGQLMTMPKIMLYLQQMKKDMLTDARITGEMVINELGKIAFGNMCNYFDGEGKIKPMHEVSDDAKAALWSLSVGDSGSGSKRVAGKKVAAAGAVGESAVEVVKFRMYNKLSALDKLAKILDLYNGEKRSPEVTYAYIPADVMDADDTFDDEELAREMEEEEELQEDELQYFSGSDELEEDVEEDFVRGDATEKIDEDAWIAGLQDDKLKAEILRMTEMQRLYKLVKYEGEWMLPHNVRYLEEKKRLAVV